MTPRTSKRRPPSKTGSSILPVSCRYPHIITYTEASVITAGSKSVDTVPTCVAMKLFTCPVSHVKKLVHIHALHALQGLAWLAPQSIGARSFCDPTSERRFASVAFMQSGVRCRCASSAHHATF